MSDSILNQGEVIIRKEDAKEYVSAGRYSSSLCLTNQRIITKRLLGSGATYPLSHNGGVILFGLSSDKNVWIQAIEQARVNATELPYETIPPQATASSNPSPSKLLWVAAFAGFVLFILTSCTIALTLLIFQLNSH